MYCIRVNSYYSYKTLSLFLLTSIPLTLNGKALKKKIKYLCFFVLWNIELSIMVLATAQVRIHMIPKLEFNSDMSLAGLTDHRVPLSVFSLASIGLLVRPRIFYMEVVIACKRVQWLLQSDILSS